jgi:drug/metabolite transporter (DMT)-like permease
LSKTNTLAKLALLLATIIWGSSFIIMKDALDNIGTFFLLAVRFTGACLLLAVLFWKKLRLLNGYYIKAGFVMGSMLLAAYAVQTFGLAETTPGKNAFLTAGYCVMVPFLYWFVAGKRPDRYNISAAVLCVLGIGLVSLDSNLTMGRGDVLTIACGLFYALHIIVSARYTQGSDVMLLTISQFFFAAIWSWVLFLICEPIPVLDSVPVATWLSLAYLCVFATAGALWMQMYGLKYTAPAAGALILSLEAVFGVIFSVALGAETVTPRLLLGFAIIFVAVVVSETKLEFLQKKKATNPCCSGDC